MNLGPDYPNVKVKQRDRAAGAAMAVLVNVAMLWLIDQSPTMHHNSDLENFTTILPWVINGLFLLVFLLILPQFALGYLIGIAICIAVPVLLTALLLAGCFLLLGFESLAYSGAAFEDTCIGLFCFSSIVAGVGVAIWWLGNVLRGSKELG